MKRIALLVLVTALVAPQSFAGNSFIKSLDAASKKAKASNSLIFVDLFASWCGWCHRFEQEVVPSEAFQKATDDMVLLRLNTEDGGEGTKFAQKYNVTSLPTFLVLTPDLGLAAIIKGYYPAATFATLVGEAKKKQAEFEKRVANEGKLAKDYPARLELAKEFNARQAYDKSEPRLRKLTTEKGVPTAVRDQAFYELAVAQFLQKKYPDTLKTLSTLHSLQKTGEPVERGRLLASQVYMDQGNILGAANELRAFKKSYPNSPLIATVNAILPQLEQQLQTKTQ